MTLNIPRNNITVEIAAAAARLTGTPEQVAARLRRLLDEGAPKAGPRESADARREREAETAAQQRAVAAHQHRLAADFAEARGWRVTTAPLAVKEVARRGPPGGNWHRPPREWLGTMFHPTFYRDSARRAAAMVAHPLAEVVEQGRIEIEMWAAERELTVSFPDVASWQDPGRNVLAVFEPTAPAEVADLAPAHVEPRLDTSQAPSTAPDLASMRPIRPVDLDGVEPADLAAQVAPVWELVAPTELLVDESYQRDLSPKSLALIRRIASGWDWRKFKAPICARVDGRLHVLDGQHTAAGAASHGGVPLIPVLVVIAPEAVDRARAFISHATDRLPTTITQVHHAAVLAGDEDALTIDRVCHAAGVDLVAFPPPRSAYRPGQTVALNAIRRVVDKRGAMRARQVLEVLAKADLAPISADHIRAAEALLCDPDLSGEVDAERITAGMRALAAKGYVEAKTLAATKNLVLWRAMVAVILKARRSRPKGGRQSDGLTTGDAAEVEGEAA